MMVRAYRKYQRYRSCRMLRYSNKLKTRIKSPIPMKRPTVSCRVKLCFKNDCSVCNSTSKSSLVYRLSAAITMSQSLYSFPSMGYTKEGVGSGLESNGKLSPLRLNCCTMLSFCITQHCRKLIWGLLIFTNWKGPECSNLRTGIFTHTQFGMSLMGNLLLIRGFQPPACKSASAFWLKSFLGVKAYLISASI